MLRNMFITAQLCTPYMTSCNINGNMKHRNENKKKLETYQKKNSKTIKKKQEDTDIQSQKRTSTDTPM